MRGSRPQNVSLGPILHQIISCPQRHILVLPAACSIGSNTQTGFGGRRSAFGRRLGAGVWWAHLNPSEGSTMAILRIVQPPMVTKETYDAVNAHLSVHTTPPEGLIMHSAGELDGTWQIVDVWESEQHAQRFDSERLGPAVEAVAGATAPTGPPRTTVYELHNLLIP
ncbi:MAG: hypothetical protein QOE67_311 [Solirubrobacteraceae bacterium]|jgi:hypothetical protein|nr:hypothetical protein [Solirubrobacteraceae bacterium]